MNAKLELRPPVEQMYTAMRFAACANDQASIDLIWQRLHDDLVASFPRRSRSAVSMRIYEGAECGDIIDAIERAGGVESGSTDPAQEYSTLKAEAARLGLLIIVSVDVAMDLS